MSSIIEAFYEHLFVIKSLAQNTIKAYISDLEEYESFLSALNIELLSSTSEDLLKFLANIENPRTQNRKLSSINSFFDFCFEYYDNIKKPIGTFTKLPKQLPKYLHYNDILNTANQIDITKRQGLRDYAIILFMYATGVRVSELIHIKKEDINENWLTILYAKGSKQRVVPIAYNALDALNSYLKQRTDKEDELFISYQGKGLSRISIYKITKKYFGYSPHIFRHSFATSLILGGANLLVVSELLGHSNLETTQIYTHIEQHHLKETVNKYHPLNNI